MIVKRTRATPFGGVCHRPVVESDPLDAVRVRSVSLSVDSVTGRPRTSRLSASRTVPMTVPSGPVAIHLRRMRSVPVAVEGHHTTGADSVESATFLLSDNRPK